MSQYASTTADEAIIIKVRYWVTGEVIARKIPIPKMIKLDKLEHKIRERFEITDDKKIELSYQDEEDEDRVVVTYDDELFLALHQEVIPSFELIVKSKIVGNTFLYPQPIKGSPGEVVDVWIASQYLTISHAQKEDTKAWGTFIYTDDSDLVKVLCHSEKLELSEMPPRYNIVATLQFLSGCIKYLGSTQCDITTQDYGAYGTSYVVVNVRMVPLTTEKKNYSTVF